MGTYSKSEDEKEEEDVSSDYKIIPEQANTAVEGLHLLTDHAVTESGTDDQFSSGTFSQDDISPRFAELPGKMGLGNGAAADVKKTKNDRTLSMETRTTSITSDASEQEIPASSPRSALTLSPTTETSSSTRFVYGESIEKSTTDSMDIMTQSIYIGAEDCDSEVSSESHQSMVSQTTQRKISSTEDSNIKTTLKEEYTLSEAVVKVSDNITENILEETKSITKKAEVVSKEESNVQSEKSKETTIEKIVETRQEAKMSYSEVVKADTSKVTASVKEEKSLAKEAIGEVLKADTVHHLVDSKAEGSPSSSGKKMSYSEVVKSEKFKDDPIADWGKPLGLPSPNRPGTPAKQAKKTDEEPIDTNKTKDAIEPVWMDLAYVPHHGSSNYANAEFFKRVRARYYVFSGVEPSRDVFNALLEAKKTWENKDQEVTIIPTYDTDVLGYWVAENEELLTELRIDLAPSASRCTINLQDHETSCAAYRLEF